MPDRRILLVVAVFALAFFGSATASFAQDLSLSFPADGSLTQSSIILLLLVTVLSIVPGLAIMITCFPFVVTVLSILRQAIGLQQAPPNMLIVSLALFLTYFVMAPVFETAWVDGIRPYLDQQLDLGTAFENTLRPFRAFMVARSNPETYAALADLRPNRPDAPLGLTQDTDLSILMPTFMLSEIERAFQIGFLIFLPFLIIDLVVAAVLMSMGMMMVPPAMVALPFKLAFFVVADGWTLLSTALIRSYF